MFVFKWSEVYIDVMYALVDLYVIGFEVKNLISGEKCMFKLCSSPIILNPLTVFSTNQVLYFNALLTPCSRVLLEKLTGFQVVKKFPRLYGAQRFITTFTSACHLALSLASMIQSIPPHPTS